MKNIILCDDCDFKKVLEISKKYDFGIEIQSFHKPQFYEDNPSIIDIYKKDLKDIKITSLHAPFGDLCPGSSDPMVRDVARNRFELAYKIATELNIFNIVFHVGWVPGAGVPKNWAGRCADFWNEFLQGKSEKMNYYIENLFDKNPEVLSDVISNLNKSNVKVCLDIGHANCYSDISVTDWIKNLKDKIGYVHIHDNNGEKDEHLGLGKGSISLTKVLNALNIYAPNAIWALEAKPEDLSNSIEWLSKNNFI